MLDRYGEKDKTYALVTGASDGIGLAMCENLAKQGFNIIMMSRNLQKMKEKAEEIQKNIPERTVQFKYIVADFGQLNSIC